MLFLLGSHQLSRLQLSSTARHSISSDTMGLGMYEAMCIIIKKFLDLFLFNVYEHSSCMYACVTRLPGSPGTGVRDSCEPPFGC